MKLTTLRQWARHLKTEMHALAIAYTDPRVPWYARLFLLVVVGYALSPIDLIPDFIPILGLLDDLLLLPLGIALVLKMLPPEVMTNAREQARQSVPGIQSLGRIAALFIVCTWLLLALLLALFAYRLFF